MKSPRMLCFAAVVCCVGVCAEDALGQRLELYVEGLEKPVDFVADPTHDERFYVVEQAGTIRVIEDGRVLDEPFFEADRSNFTDRNWEQGLLGIVLDPGFAENGRFYVNYTGRGGTTHVSRFTVESPRRADPESEEVILAIEQPWGNHNAGNLIFGPDGMLYIPTGDGGSANDPRGYAQNLGSLLGKMLRIDVTGEPDEGKKYAVPPDNPFVEKEGARPEIWAYGLRNPWGVSFDSKGRFWIADVGQDRVEEINLQPADSEGGENYGWNIMEGREIFTPRKSKRAEPQYEPGPDGPDISGLTMPVWDYRHAPFGSVTGGHFYEGEDVPSLRERYLFADFMMGRFWSFRVTDEGKADDVVEHTRAMAEAFLPEGAQMAVSAFGVDNRGELYVLDLKGGRVFRVVE